MRLLLDTHVALWATVQSRSLSARAKALIADPNNSVAVSVASVWEIAIKHALGRRRPDRMPVSASIALGLFQAAGYQVLDISAAHAVAIESLPPLHADPFDRMLVAQALAEPMHLLTSDDDVAAYSAAIIRV
jgi:PIN domain nuclease of toxin-antitoxin system